MRCSLTILTFLFHFFLSLLLIFLIVIDQLINWKIIDAMSQDYAYCIHKLRLDAHAVSVVTNLGELLQCLD